MKLRILPVLGVLLGLGTGALAQEVEPPPPPPPDDGQVASPPPAEAPPPSVQQPSQQSFDQQLAPYGRWVMTAEYGRVWVPNVGPDWQPYADGQWVDSTSGWTFVSGLPWGRIVFHYGRWGFRENIGWFWVPGYTWGPGWVTWRYVNGYACWSPMVPAGFRYGRYWPGWVVVPHQHFTSPIRRWAVRGPQLGVIVRSARPVRAFPSYRARVYVRPGWRGHGRWRR